MSSHTIRILLLLGALMFTGACSLFSRSVGLTENTQWALGNDALVYVQTEPFLTIAPNGREPLTGIIFYPGGKVKPSAYAPLLRGLAAQGYLVVVPDMPLDLAVLGANRARQVIAEFPAVRQWVIGGHSLGGAMATGHALRDNHYEAVVLLAAYPTNRRYPEAAPPTLAIFASNDGLVTTDDRLKAERLLPRGSRSVILEGGNHAQFGAYGLQMDDGVATISDVEQWRQTQDLILDFLEGLGL
ncbi:alpha/beta hydrolase [Salinispirillum sp. LH 10-3-1]|uniref:Alpha/beta hydrolase n=1 Tax=Salinispirillum sp. LH 10-3-1 TaxID=2952525 RepID=A0AB38YI73_9GAMM